MNWRCPIRSEDLITAVASASGIDLCGAARTSAKAAKSQHTATRRKHGVTSTILLEPPASRAKGTATRTSVRPKWTLAELGQASKGVPAIAFQAACYAFAGDQSQYWTLHAALWDRAKDLAERRLWPKTVCDIHGLQQEYLGHLAILLLDSERERERFAKVPRLRSVVWMRVSDRVWERDLADRYKELCDVWEGWLAQAARMIQSKLRNTEEIEDESVSEVA